MIQDMKINKKLLLTTTFGLTAAWSGLSAQEKRPNIILFMVDDMGWQDTSLPFWTEKTPLNGRYHTPNMERLAQMGAKFTSAYACSISSPSRCSLMTGANAARHRVTNWTLGYNSSTDNSDPDLNMPAWNVNGIQPVEGIERSYHNTSFVQLLKQSGYHTIHCGKAHFGSMTTPGVDPMTFGFDVNICGHAAGGLASYLGEQRFGHDENGKPVSNFAIPGLEAYWDKDIFATEALTLEALKALEQARTLDRPFYLYMSHYAVHIPIQADKRFLQKYLDAGLSQTEAAYATLVEGMDKSLGDLMDYLEETNQIDNTIIIFMSDNGGLAASARTAPLHVQNAPLRSGKGSVYEGGVREPMIVYWNGVAQPGSTIDSYVMIEDFYPTILEMAGVKDYKTEKPIDGISFVPLLTGTGDPSVSRAICWNTPNVWYGGDLRAHGIGQTCAIRKGDYKLVYFYKGGKKELYNVREDVGETTDLAAEKPELVAELSRELGEYLRSVDAQRPTYKSDGHACPWPDETTDTPNVPVDDHYTDNLNFPVALVPTDESLFHKEADYFTWCNSVVRDDDGLYHLFYSRWPKACSFYGWLTHSEIAHATSTSPYGPYTYVETVMQGRGTGHWDAITAHNVKVVKFGDKYYMYYTSTNSGDEALDEAALIEIAKTGYSHKNWSLLRNNQRAGVAVASSLSGPWTRYEHPLIEPEGPIRNVAVNPSVCAMPDGKYCLIIKGDNVNNTSQLIQAVGLGDTPTGPFKLQNKPAFDNIPTEDVEVWYDENRKRYYGIFHAHGGNFIGMITSIDGINWSKAVHYKVCMKNAPTSDGNIMNFERMERPSVYIEDGSPQMLSFGVKQGNSSYIIRFKLDFEALSNNLIEGGENRTYTINARFLENNNLYLNNVSTGGIGVQNQINDSALWYFLPRTDGSWNIRNKATGRYLTPIETNGANITSSENIPAEGWNIRKTMQDGAYAITSGLTQAWLKGSGLKAFLTNYGGGFSTGNTRTQFEIMLVGPTN